LYRFTNFKYAGQEDLDYGGSIGDEETEESRFIFIDVVPKFAYTHMPFNLEFTLADSSMVP